MNKKISKLVKKNFQSKKVNAVKNVRLRALVKLE